MVFIDLIFAQRRLRSEEPPPTWAAATKAQQIVEPSGHPGAPSATCLHGGFEETRDERL